MNMNQIGTAMRFVASVAAVGLAVGSTTARAGITDPYLHLIQDGELYEGASGYTAGQAYTCRTFDNEEGQKSVHPAGGWGYLADGNFHCDFTIAICGVFPEWTGEAGDNENYNGAGGLIASFGGAGSKNQLAFTLRTIKGGNLVGQVVQRWNTGKNQAILKDTYCEIPYSPDGFHTIVMTRSNSGDRTMTYYVDGVYAGSVNGTSEETSRTYASGIQIGNLVGGVYSSWVMPTPLSGDQRMQFKDLRIFKRVLSAAEVGQYAAAFPAGDHSVLAQGGTTTWSALVGTNDHTVVRVNSDKNTTLKLDRFVNVTDELRFQVGKYNATYFYYDAGYEEQTGINDVTLEDGFVVALMPRMRFGGKLTVGNGSTLYVGTDSAVTNNMALLRADGGIVRTSDTSTISVSGTYSALTTYYDDNGTTLRCRVAAPQVTLEHPTCENAIVTVRGEVTDIGSPVDATLYLEWSTNAEFSVIADSANLGKMTETGPFEKTISGISNGSWYFRVTAKNSLGLGTTLAADKPVDVQVNTLDEDADWRTHVWVENEMLDLNGHTLTMSPPGCPVVITGIEEGSALILDVPEGETCLGSDIKRTGSFTFVKAGPGTYEQDVATTWTGDTIVSNGYARVTVGGAYATGHLITVAKGGTFDVNGQANSYYSYALAGDGPDGLGALRNTRADFASNAIGIAPDGITLTDDATIYAEKNFAVISSGYGAIDLRLGGHKLTFSAVNSGKGFFVANLQDGGEAGKIVLKKGILNFLKAGSDLSNVDVVVDGEDSQFWIASNLPTTYMKTVTLMGGEMDYQKNCLCTTDFSVYDGSTITSAAAWIYVSGTVLVSNETTDITLPMPFHEWGSDFPALVKKGAGTLTLANVHNQNRFGDGVEVFGGSVVLDQNSPHQALMPYSLGGADLTMHDGTTLDMTACGTDELRFSTLDVAAGAQIVGVAGNVIAARGGTALPAGFAFEGTLNMAADSTLTVNVPDPEAYAKKSLLTGLSANSLANAASIAVVFGAKPDRWYYVVCPAEDLTEEQVAALSQKLNVSGPGVKPEKWSFERANNELRLYGPYPGFQFIVR